MKKEKTMHELSKEFPDKSYRELEIYRDADRQEEAARIPLTESQQKQKELEPIEDEIGTCITASMQRDKVATELQVMKRRAQEAEGELSILKGIETNRVKEAQDALLKDTPVQSEEDELGPRYSCYNQDGLPSVDPKTVPWMFKRNKDREDALKNWPASFQH